jgi:hypothetical protein
MQKTLVLCGLVMILLAPPSRRLLLAEPSTPLAFDVKLDVVKQELHPDFCWFHPRVAAIPGAGCEGRPAVVMTLQKHLGISDHYSGMWMMRTDDLARTWTGPTEIPDLAWGTEPGGVVRAVADVTPGWHPPSGKLIAMDCRLPGSLLPDDPQRHPRLRVAHGIGVEMPAVFQQIGKFAE